MARLLVERLPNEEKYIKMLFCSRGYLRPVHISTSQEKQRIKVRARVRRMEYVLVMERTAKVRANVCVFS